MKTHNFSIDESGKFQKVKEISLSQSEFGDAQFIFSPPASWRNAKVYLEYYAKTTPEKRIRTPRLESGGDGKFVYDVTAHFTSVPDTVIIQLVGEKNGKVLKSLLKSCPDIKITPSINAVVDEAENPVPLCGCEAFDPSEILTRLDELESVATFDPSEILQKIETKLTVPSGGNPTQLINGIGDLITPTATPANGSLLPFTAGGAYTELNKKAPVDNPVFSGVIQDDSGQLFSPKHPPMHLVAFLQPGDTYDINLLDKANYFCLGEWNGSFTFGTSDFQTTNLPTVLSAQAIPYDLIYIQWQNSTGATSLSISMEKITIKSTTARVRIFKQNLGG